MAGLLDFLMPSQANAAEGSANAQAPMQQGLGPNAALAAGMGLLGGSWSNAGTGFMQGALMDNKMRREQEEERRKKQQQAAMASWLETNGANMNPQTRALLASNPELFSKVAEKQLVPDDPKYVTGGDGRMYAIAGGKASAVPGIPGSDQRPEAIRTAEQLQRIISDPNASPQSKEIATIQLRKLMQGTNEFKFENGFVTRNGVPITDPDVLRANGINPDVLPGFRDARKAEQERRAQENVARGKEVAADNVQSAIDNIRKADQAANLPTTGPMAEYVKKLPIPTGAKDIEASLTTLKANVGFQQLQAMREASPTGGALGQVAVEELRALQNAIASLEQSQSREQFFANLDRVEKTFQQIVHGPGAGKSGGKGGGNATRDALRKKYGLE
jgi:hypothetical protein